MVAFLAKPLLVLYFLDKLIDRLDNIPYILGMPSAIRLGSLEA
jgi:hypothetical protein